MRKELFCRPEYSRVSVGNIDAFLCEMAGAIKNSSNSTPLQSKDNDCVEATMWSSAEPYRFILSFVLQLIVFLSI